MNKPDELQDQEAGACCPGCKCETGSRGTRTKWVICGVVALAAAATAAVHVARSPAPDTQSGQTYAAAALPAAVDAQKAEPAAISAAWGAPLKSLDELNQVAANTDAVFVVLPSDNAARTAEIQKTVAAAAATITARGTRVGTFILSPDSPQYAGLAQQAGSPAVLAMCKGMGMAMVQDQQVAQDSLLKAFVSASRPSGCGPSGCGPSSSGCK